jgi:hypothetical protein
MAGKLTQYRCTVTNIDGKIHTAYVNARTADKARELATHLLPWHQTLISVDNVVGKGTPRW